MCQTGCVRRRESAFIQCYGASDSLLLCHCQCHCVKLCASMCRTGCHTLCQLLVVLLVVCQVVSIGVSDCPVCRTVRANVSPRSLVYQSVYQFVRPCDSLTCRPVSCVSLSGRVPLCVSVHVAAYHDTPIGVSVGVPVDQVTWQPDISSRVVCPSVVGPPHGHDTVRQPAGLPGSWRLGELHHRLVARCMCGPGGEGGGGGGVVVSPGPPPVPPTSRR